MGVDDLLAAGENSHFIARLDVSTLQRQQVWAYPYAVSVFDADSAGKVLYTSTPYGQEIVLLSTTTGERVGVINSTDIEQFSIMDMRRHPLTGDLYLVDPVLAVVAWLSPNGTLLATLPLSGPVFDEYGNLDIDAAGEYLYVCYVLYLGPPNFSEIVRRVRLSDFQFERRNFTFATPPHYFIPDVVAVGAEGDFMLYDSSTYELLEYDSRADRFTSAPSRLLPSADFPFCSGCQPAVGPRVRRHQQPAHCDGDGRSDRPAGGALSVYEWRRLAAALPCPGGEWGGCGGRHGVHKLLQWHHSGRSTSTSSWCAVSAPARPANPRPSM